MGERSYSHRTARIRQASALAVHMKRRKPPHQRVPDSTPRQAIAAAKVGGAVFLRWSAVPQDDRRRMTQYRKARGVVTDIMGDVVGVSWDSEPAEYHSREWLCAVPEWGD